VIFAYGGAGPMHCAFYGAECGVDEVIVPVRAGTFSALGVASAPLLHSARAATFVPMPMDVAQFSEQLRALDDKVVAALDADQVPEEHREVTYLLEMRYGAQVHTVRVPVARRERYDDAAVAEVCLQFDVAYERLYGAGSGYPDAGRFLTTFIVEGRGNVPLPAEAVPASIAGQSSADQALAGSREAYFDGTMVPTDVYRYELLLPGNALRGPAIIDADQTTAVIPPGATATVDEHRNLRIGNLNSNTVAAPAAVGAGSIA
jgi:N-methylhydantoinase A